MEKRQNNVDEVIRALGELVADGNATNSPKAKPAARFGKSSLEPKQLLKKSITLIHANSTKEAIRLLEYALDMLEVEDLRTESVEKSRQEPAVLKKAQPQNVLQMTARQQIALRNGVPTDLPGLEHMNTVSEMKQAAQRARLEGLRPVFRSVGTERRLDDLIKHI